jgi:hypothetical protein
MCFVLLIATKVYGQFERGGVLIGGSVLVSSGAKSASITSPEIKARFLQVAPKVGYFFFKNLASGIRLSYLYQSENVVQLTAR